MAGKINKFETCSFPFVLRPLDIVFTTILQRHHITKSPRGVEKNNSTFFLYEFRERERAAWFYCFVRLWVCFPFSRCCHHQLVQSPTNSVCWFHFGPELNGKIGTIIKAIVTIRESLDSRTDIYIVFLILPSTISLRIFFSLKYIPWEKLSRRLLLLEVQEILTKY
jgi:hypothetical protein